MLTLPLLLHTATGSKNYPWMHGKSYILETGIGPLWLTEVYTVNCEYFKAAVGKGLLY
jgi:hypothetical protein